MNADSVREIALRVSQYFRDFLESDFKRQQAPRRRLIFHTESGFRSGMRIASYPDLARDVWALISRPSGSDLTLDITPRKYTRPISATLQRVIEEQIQVIPETAIVSVQQSVLDHARATYAGAVTDPEMWIDATRALLAQEIGQRVIRPLIAHLDGPMHNHASSVMDTLYAAESELIATTAHELDAALSGALAKLLATGQDEPLRAACRQFLTLEGVRRALRQFFEGFVAADGYLEFRDLDTYAATAEA